MAGRGLARHERGEERGEEQGAARHGLAGHERGEGFGFMNKLRWYQTKCVKSIYDFLDQYPQGNPCAVLPTGSGKTLVLAQICQDISEKWGGRVLVLAHVKELLQQSASKLQSFLPVDKVGIYSAGLDSRDTTHPVIVAGIQSVYKRAGDLGPFTAVIVDEAHLIPSHDGGMYRTFIADAKLVNPSVRIIGLTATPYRLDCGWICAPENILHEICYEVGVKELITQGFLCPLKTRAGKEHPDLQGIHTRGGEYIESEMAERMDKIVLAACEEVVQLTQDRKSVLIFASSIEHAQHIQETLIKMTGIMVGFVCGETPSDERATLLNKFKSGEMKYIVNMNVLTTGFDAPNIDAIVLLRATLSPGLFYQMVGRGLRVCEGKENCIVLDYGENTMRHGPIDMIQIDRKQDGRTGEAPSKECPQCQAVIFAGYSSCPECGFEFPAPDLKHNDKAGEAEIISGVVIETEYDVTRTRYYLHRKRNKPEATPTMRVEYEIKSFPPESKKEWVCIEHEGFAGNKARRWWADRSIIQFPSTVEMAVKLANAGALSETSKILYKQTPGKPFGEILRYEIADEKPKLSAIDASLKAEEKINAELKEENEFAVSYTDNDIPF